MTMATRKRQRNSEDNGGDNGGDNGSSSGILAFDDFVDRVKLDGGALLDQAYVAAMDAEGRTFGSRLGKLPLQPIDSLDDRIRDEWDGPRRVALRVKHTDGSWAFAGYFDIPAPRKQAPAASGESAALAVLAQQLDKLSARLDAALSANKGPPAEDVKGKADTFATLLAEVKSLIQPAQQQVQAVAPRSLRDELDAMKMVKEFAVDALGLKPGDGAATSVALELAKSLGPALGDVTRATAALVAAKAAAAATTNEEEKGGGKE
jgi:hypothetical protein